MSNHVFESVPSQRRCFLKAVAVGTAGALLTGEADADEPLAVPGKIGLTTDLLP